MSSRSLIYGLHSVEHVLRTRPQSVRELLIEETRRGGRFEKLLALARNNGVEVRSVTRGKLDEQVPGARHQGVLAYAEGDRVWTETELLDSMARTGNKALALMLDGVTDPHN